MRMARVYEERHADDGVRVLVDRLWPRGIRKEDPRIDRWFKDVAPSTELRKWYNHQPERFKEFSVRYEKELRSSEEAAPVLEELRDLDRSAGVTLLTATKEVRSSELPVLVRVLKG